jgi:hypothetical protein
MHALLSSVGNGSFNTNLRVISLVVADVTASGSQLTSAWSGEPRHTGTSLILARLDLACPVLP